MKHEARSGSVTLLVAAVCASVLLTVVVLTVVNSGDVGVAGLAIAVLFVAVSIALIVILTGQFRPLSLIAILIYCHVVLFIGRPGFAVLYQDSTNLFTRRGYDQSFLQAQLVAGVGLVCLVAAYCLVVGRRQNHADVLAVPSDLWARVRTGLWILVVVGFSLYLLYILQVGWASYWGSVFSGRSDENRSALQSSSAYLYAGLRFATGALILVFFQAMSAGWRKSAVVSITLIVLAAVPSFVSGNRSDFIPIAVALVMILAATRPGFARARNAVFGLPIFVVVFLVAPRLWRNDLSTGGSIIDSISESLSLRGIFEGFLGGYDTAMVDAFSVQIATQASGSLPPAFGSTYLAALLSVVPRNIWPGKPESVDEVLNSAIFPATDARGIGFAFGFYSEPHFNFGIWGVVAVALIFGILLGVITRAHDSSPNLFMAYVYVMTAAHLFPIMRGSLTFSSQRLLIPLIPVLIVLVVFAGRYLRYAADGSGRESARVADRIAHVPRR